MSVRLGICKQSVSSLEFLAINFITSRQTIIHSSNIYCRLTLEAVSKLEKKINQSVD